MYPITPSTNTRHLFAQSLEWGGVPWDSNLNYNMGLGGQSWSLLLAEATPPFLTEGTLGETFRKSDTKMASKLENGPLLLPAVEARIGQKQVFF
jgi:hypothetical protein